MFSDFVEIFIFPLVKSDKEKSTEKIDGAVAAIMALDRAIRHGRDTGIVKNQHPNAPAL